jgi:hypothetical protein
MLLPRFFIGYPYGVPLVNLQGRLPFLHTQLEEKANVFGKTFLLNVVSMFNKFARSTDQASIPQKGTCVCSLRRHENRRRIHSPTTSDYYTAYLLTFRRLRWASLRGLFVSTCRLLDRQYWFAILNWGVSFPFFRPWRTSCAILNKMFSDVVEEPFFPFANRPE